MVDAERLGRHSHAERGNDRAIGLVLITLQDQFAETIQVIETQKQQAQASLEKSDTLFNSLLQHTFKGELTA